MELNKLLIEARKRYPIGTKFRVATFSNLIATVKNHDIYEYVSDKVVNFYIEENFSGCIGAMVYKEGEWAEIISLGEVKLVKQNYKYLIKLFKKLKIK